MGDMKTIRDLESISFKCRCFWGAISKIKQHTLFSKAQFENQEAIILAFPIPEK